MSSLLYLAYMRLVAIATVLEHVPKASHHSPVVPQVRRGRPIGRSASTSVHQDTLRGATESDLAPHVVDTPVERRGLNEPPRYPRTLE
jgi:hypothetical protein